MAALLWRAVMLLASDAALASFSGVALPDASSGSPKLLHEVHRLRAIGAIESWQKNDGTNCAAFEDLVRDATGLKPGSGLILPKNQKPLCLSTDSLHDCDQAINLISMVVRQGGLSKWCEAGFLAPTEASHALKGGARKLGFWDHLACIGAVVGTGATCIGSMGLACAAGAVAVPSACGDTIDAVTDAVTDSSSDAVTDSSSDSNSECSWRSDGECDDGGPGSEYSS